jgi:hypothetical protein
METKTKAATYGIVNLALAGMMSSVGISSGFTYYVVIMGSHIVSLLTVTTG